MSVKKLALHVTPDDNVLVALENIEKGEIASAKDGTEVVANEFIKQGHKIAICDIKKDDPVIKYAYSIGPASQDIKRGDWVHSHNLEDTTTKQLAQECEDFRARGKAGFIPPETPVKPKISRDTIMAYPRPDGRFGIRNYVIVISLVQCANGTAQKIALACGNIPCIVVEAACGEFTERFERTKLGFITAGIHPNVHGVLLVSLGCQQTDPEEVKAEIAKYGKEVEHLCIQTDGGVTGVIEKGIQIVKGMQERAAQVKRQPCPVTGMITGCYTGGSDWTSGLSSNRVMSETSGLHYRNGGIIVAGVGRGGTPDEAETYEVGLKLMEISDRFNEDCTARSGVGLSDVNPTPGNKAGGLTTMIEKMARTAHGRDGKVKAIEQPGFIPTGPGVWGIDQPQGANDAYACTTMAMSGMHLLMFTTGKGTPLGTAVMPCVKITGNPVTVETLGEMIDYSAVPVLYGEKSVEEAGMELYELLLDICEGKPTKSELLEDWSYTIPHGTSYNGDYEKPCQK